MRDCHELSESRATEDSVIARLEVGDLESDSLGPKVFPRAERDGESDLPEW